MSERRPSWREGTRRRSNGARGEESCGSAHNMKQYKRNENMKE
jgi:hypothetical protein